jgi:biotin carboxylase
MATVCVGAVSAAIRALARQRLSVVVLHTPNRTHRLEMDACRDEIAATACIPSLEDTELALSALEQLGVAGQIDHVVPLHEMAVTPAAVIAAALRVDHPYSGLVALAGRDKAVQKARWTAAGVPTAAAHGFLDLPANVDDVEQALAGMKPPFVVKPVAGGGTKMVRSCADSVEVFEYLSSEPVELARAVVEEWQHGTEWHLDGTLIDGEIVDFMLSRYMAPLVQTQQGQPLRSVAFPPSRFPDEYRPAREFADRAQRALGRTSGTFHLETFGEPGAFRAGELAWRPPGVLATTTAKWTIGVELWEAHAQIYSRRPIERTPADPDHVYGFVCLPIRPGYENGLTYDDLVGLPGVLEIRKLTPVGAVMPAMRFSTLSVANALVRGDSVEDCERLIDQSVCLVNEMHERRSTRAVGADA